MIPKSGCRFSDEIMLKQQAKAKYRKKLKSFRFSAVRRLVIVAFLMPLIATLAPAEENPGDCLGIGFDVTHPVTIAKIIADRPQVHLVKSAYDDPYVRQTARLARRRVISFRAICC
jgi:hypothetical protein